MTPKQWEKIERLFQSAAERTKGERAAYLESACDGDAELRREVESLLAHGTIAEGWLGGEALKEMAEEVLDGASGLSLSGQQLGPYQVLSAIGAGGMGEVYRARDTKLGRDVAIKVLPTAFANDPERLARFQREARLLAALNHPNIAAIYGLEESSGARALVMELVEGLTLADRIKNGPIPLDEALPIAKQVAEALEYAHERGVIHRDLKPANIKVKPDGTVKVLDFGLAKALTDDPAPGDMSNSPTLSMGATVAGVILGTAAYMSPEQAKAKPVDRRADIWAFGCVLYEVLTGTQLYIGETAAETLASVMNEAPVLKALPKNTPPAIANLLRRCLERNVRQRLQHIGEARIVIEGVLSGAGPTERVVTNRKSLLRNVRFLWGVSFVFLVAALALGTFFYSRRIPEDKGTISFFFSPPDTWSLAQVAATGAPNPLAVSPDGHQIAFVATSRDGRTLLWVRSLDSPTAQALIGTEGASRPFWSPDSRFLGFFADSKLKKIEVTGGAPITLCEAPNDRGGSWSRDGVIVFAGSSPGALQRVSASGGLPTAATVLGQGETAHVRPFFLPDGRHFLYRAYASTAAVEGPIFVASLNSAERKLLNADSANVIYSQGHLLFLRGTTLMAQPFDARRLVLKGEPFPIAEQIQTQGSPPSGIFSASENGVLAYQTGMGIPGSQLAWFDRAGKQIGVVGDSAPYGDLELSPDGKRASVNIPDQTGKGRHIWLYDLQRGLRTRFTFDPADEFTSIWSPDGSRLVFNSRRKGHLDLYQKASSGAGTDELLLEDNLDKYPFSWSPDGRFILYVSTGGPTGLDLFVVPLSGGRKPFPFLNTKFNDQPGRFSPNGRWIAYRSDESGKNEIYVAPFPGPGGKWQISAGGGIFPRWRHDGTEIFYLAPDNKLMAAAVNGEGSSFEVGAVKPLFEARVSLEYRYPYDVSPDGQRFLINTTPQRTAPVIVVVNWTTGIKK